MVEFVLDDSEWLVHFLVFDPTYSVKSRKVFSCSAFFFFFSLLNYCSIVPKFAVLLLSKIL